MATRRTRIAGDESPTRKTTKTTLSLSTALARRLAVCAAAQGRSRSALATEILTPALARFRMPSNVDPTGTAPPDPTGSAG